MAEPNGQRVWTELTLEIQIRLGRGGLAGEEEGGQGDLPFLPLIEWQSSRDLHASHTYQGKLPAWLPGQGASWWPGVPMIAQECG